MFLRAGRATVCDRKYLHFCIAGQGVIKSHFPLIHQDRVHLWMRNAARFDHILYRSFLAEAAFNGSSAGFGAEKEIEVAMKIQPNLKRLHVNRRLARGRRRIRTCSRVGGP